MKTWKPCNVRYEGKGRLHFVRIEGALATACKRAIGSVRTTSSVDAIEAERRDTGNVCWLCVKAARR